MDSEATGQAPAEQPLMTLTEAANATGRPAEAIRALVRRKKLRAIKGNDGRLLVEIPADMMQPPGQERSGRSAGRLDDPASRAIRLAEAAAGRAATAEKAAEEWRTAAEEARLTAAVAAAELAASREMVAELRRQLDHARKPWWRRLAG